jgi:hypothetical protein
MDIKCLLTNEVHVKHRVFIIFLNFKTRYWVNKYTNIKANNNGYFYCYYFDTQKHIFHIFPTWKLWFVLISRYYISLFESPEKLLFFEE